MGYNDTEGLAGHRIDKIYVGGDAMAFVTDAGVWRYDLAADCCSETWMADVVGFDKVAGKTIVRVEDELPAGYSVEDGRCRQESDDAYGIKLVADDGSVAFVVYRNSSNGYYGGWVTKAEDGNLYGLAEVATSWSSGPT